MGNDPWSSEVRAWLTDVSWTKNFARADQAVTSDPARIRDLLDFINSDQGSTKFTAEKILRNLSVSHPALLYPHFDVIVSWLDSPNAFIQWGGIFILGNLVAVDGEHRFPALFERFFALLNQPAMITAANVAATVPAIIRHYPELEPEITRRLLAVTANTYYRKNQPSPECKNILLGHVLDSMDAYCDAATAKDQILGFVQSLTDNSRAAVARKARKFLEKHQR
ncbi:MAG: hypothetical protein EOM70_07210 [Clostridia bacterium]|nr:hypothetical protein [Clostridia bacterium]